MHEYTAAELRAAVSARFANVAMFRQAPWTASLITDDAGLMSSDADEELEAEVRKTAGTDPGNEVYTIAIASDGPLPELGRLGVLCEAPEVRGWADRVAALERVVRDLQEATRYLSQEREHVAARLSSIEASSTWRTARLLQRAAVPWRRRRPIP